MLKTKRRGIFLVLFLMMTLPMVAQNAGDEFEFDGLHYSILDATKQTIRVVSKRKFKQDTEGTENKEYAYENTLSGILDFTKPVIYKDKGWRVTEIGERALQRENITEVKLPEGITKIGYKAFFQTKSLQKINFPKSLRAIEQQAFYGSGLTEVNILGATAIGNAAFLSCTKMTTLTIPNVTFLGTMCFRHCSQLKTVTVPVSANIGKSCDASLKDYNLLFDLFKDRNLKIYYENNSGNVAFGDCYNLTKAILQDGITTVPEAMFSFCGDLKDITIPASVKSVQDDAFRRCLSLTSINIPEVESIGNSAFLQCWNLRGDLILSNKVKEIKDFAFDHTGFSGIKWEGTDGCKIGNSVFHNCPLLEYVDLHTLKAPTVNNKTLTRHNPNTQANFANGLLSRTIVYLPQDVDFTFGKGEDVNFVKSDGTCTKLSVQDGADFEFPVKFKAKEAVYNKWEVDAIQLDAENSKIRYADWNWLWDTDDSKTYDFGDFLFFEDGEDGEIMPLTEYRNFSGMKDGKNCFTMLLPYKVQLPKGFRAYELHLKDNYATSLQGESDYTQYYLFQSVDDESVLEANKPYLLRIVDGKEHSSEEFVATDVEIAASGSTVKVNDDGNEVTETPPTSAFCNVYAGTLKPQGYKAVEPNQEFLFMGGTERLNNELAANLNTWLLNTDSKGIDVWRPVNGGTATAAPFRGYIQPRNNATSNAKHFIVLMENETTGIDDLQQDKALNGAQRIYTLDGRYVGTSFDTLPNGIYVIKGKKIVK
ncbi:leucine-rich repeat domain-containing protein [Hoylesella timonensis]|uniref:leucine-rich repeat domain-containing protein n=1 Tax=Hoylesella timonensis TaxID=386414 RepID=UPI00242FC48C|nr:leucine-rich repeat domain-containing protein [Hoylesella timonensis]